MTDPQDQDQDETEAPPPRNHQEDDETGRQPGRHWIDPFPLHER